MRIDEGRREREKAQRRNRILEVAERMWTERGYERTSIDQVAAAAGFTKRTLYQYFESKSELYYAIVVKEARVLEERYDEIYRAKAGALEKLNRLNAAFYGYFLDHPDLYRLVSRSPSDAKEAEIGPNRRELMALKRATAARFREVLRQGQADGSLDPGLDLDKASLFGMIVSMGLLDLVASYGEEFWAGQGIGMRDFVGFAHPLISRVFKRD